MTDPNFDQAAADTPAGIDAPGTPASTLNMGTTVVGGPVHPDDLKDDEGLAEGESD